MSVLDRKSVKSYTPKAVPVAAIVALVKVALEAIEKKNFQKWQSDISGQLNEISEKLDTIIRDIQALEGEIREVPNKTAVILFRTEIDSRRQRIEEVIAGVNNGTATEEEKRRLVRLTDDLSGPLNQLQTWPEFGFEPYSAVLSGVLAMLLAYQYTETKKGETQQFCRNVIKKYLVPALASNIPQSFENSRNIVAAEIIARDTELKSLLNKWWLVNYSEHRSDPGEPGPCNPRICALINYGKGKVGPYNGIETTDGNNIQAVSFQAIHAYPTQLPNGDFVIQKRETSTLLAPWYPYLPRHFDMGDSWGASQPSVYYDLRDQRAAPLKATLEKEAGLRTHIAEISNVRELLETLA